MPWLLGSGQGENMMTLSTTTSYAIQALTCLASPDYSRAMIARGFKGGIWLSRPPEAITLLEIMTAVDGPEYLNGCLLGNACCSDERACPTHEFWGATRERIRKELGAHTLADVLVFNARRKRSAAAKARRA